jgi:hypothetical protein
VIARDVILQIAQVLVPLLLQGVTTILTVPILIPVPTNYLPPVSDTGYILGGGLILTLGSFVFTLAGLDARNVDGGVGSGRAVMGAILAEPTLILVFVGVALSAKAMPSLVVNHLLVPDPSIYWSDPSAAGGRVLHLDSGQDPTAADPFQHSHRSLSSRRSLNP